MGTDWANLHRLRVFTQVAQCLSFSRASERLFLTQPAVSALVRELERALGVPLFERKGGLRLTAAGHALHVSANKILTAVEEAEANATSAAGSISGRARVGVSHLWESRLIPFLVGFQKMHPKVFLSVAIGTADELTHALSEDRLGLIFSSSEIDDARFRIQRVAQHHFPLVVLVPSGHPLSKASLVQPMELEAFPFVHHSAHRDVEILRHLGIKARAVMEIGSGEGIAAAVAEGIGISVGVPRQVGPRVCSIPIAAAPLELSLNALTARHRQISIAEEALIEHVKNNAATVWEVLPLRLKEL